MAAGRDAELGRAYDGQVIGKLWAYVRPYRAVF